MTLPTVIPKFQPGDRVTERPKDSLLSVVRKEVRERIEPYTKQRFGVVVSNTIKVLTSRSGRKSRLCYVNILWDGLKTPSQHSQMRICLESEFNKLREDYFAIQE